jgi:hypothetical protein
MIVSTARLAVGRFVMLAKRFYGFVVSAVALLFSLIGVYAGLEWLRIPTGAVLDWVVGGLTLWWLLVITTVPWDLYFEAKDVLAETAVSRERGIYVDPNHARYVERVANRALAAAVNLHFATGLGLYLVATFGVSRVGYVGSAVALLLTGLRPASRAYDYLVARLAAIRREVVHPREDVVELRGRFAELESRVASLAKDLDADEDGSFAARAERASADLRRDLERAASDVERLRVENRREHERIAREAERAVAQVSADGEVLEHVREIVRFFKTA